MIQNSEACELAYDGTDTDGTEWFFCATHEEYSCSEICCGGYVAPQYGQVQS